MSNTLPIALTRLLEYISTIDSVCTILTHMTIRMCVGSRLCNGKHSFGAFRRRSQVTGLDKHEVNSCNHVPMRPRA